jgi:hypothetical protein
MRGITDGNVQFVCGDDSKPWISQLPPELMANNDYIHRSGRLGCVLYGMDDASGRHEQHQHDENRDHGPGNFDLAAPVYLWRLGIVVGTSPKPTMANTNSDSP